MRVYIGVIFLIQIVAYRGIQGDQYWGYIGIMEKMETTIMGYTKVAPCCKDDASFMNLCSHRTTISKSPLLALLRATLEQQDTVAEH